MKSNKIFLLFLLVPFLLLSCDPGSGADITSPSWQQNSQWYRFITNDDNYYNYAFWHTFDTTYGQFPVEVVTKKISGFSDNPYGVVFSGQSDGSAYAFYIATTGAYSIIARDSSNNYSTIVSWTANLHINGGYDTENTILITYDGTSTYTYSINGYVIGSFDRTAVALNLPPGYSGFIATAGSSANEDFPDTPVEVHFHMNQPIAAPSASIKNADYSQFSEHVIQN